MERSGPTWREVDEVLDRYRLLHAEPQDCGIQISGTFTINDDNGEIDRYQVRIVLRHDYPSSMPDVWEIGGRIPRTADSHVYPSTGQSCVMIPDQRWELWPAGSTLMQFVDGPVRSYFIGQSLVEQGKKWPSGEWEHGIFGVADYYAELLRSPSLDATLKLLAAISGPTPKGHTDCPCLSGKRMWHCHQDRIRDLQRRMGTAQALDAHRRLLDGYERHAAAVIAALPRAAALRSRDEVFELARTCIKASSG